MIPRPFMVERGHCDSVAPDEWVAYEYAKLRWMYDLLGLPDRTDIEFYTGGHCFHSQRAFDFLEKHLRWKAKPQARMTGQCQRPNPVGVSDRRAKDSPANGTSTATLELMSGS